MELYPKSAAVYADTFAMYRSNSAGYDYVLWVTQSLAVAKTLGTWQEKAGLSDRMDVVPLHATDGSVFTDSPWAL